ncbi:MAG: hypothetical protein PHS92_03915 [Candidatus Gracilibacteria bacterium]|nr:hypothetical protein [Candidatus Gracilibacteria bacterium]
MNNKIFKANGNPSTSGHFGWQGDDKMLLFYGLKEGYKNSADKLVDIALEDGGAITLDTFVFPIAFLYRHYIEIEIKRLYYYVFGKFPKQSHNLQELFNILKIDILDKSETILNLIKHNPEIISEIKSIISEFHEMDEKGDVFKYLTDKNYKPYFEEFEYINYPQIKESIDKIYNFFSYIVYIPIEDLGIFDNLKK